MCAHARREGSEWFRWSDSVRPGRVCRRRGSPRPNSPERRRFAHAKGRKSGLCQRRAVFYTRAGYGHTKPKMWRHAEEPVCSFSERRRCRRASVRDRKEPLSRVHRYCALSCTGAIQTRRRGGKCEKSITRFLHFFFFVLNLRCT